MSAFGKKPHDDHQKNPGKVQSNKASTANWSCLSKYQ